MLDWPDSHAASHRLRRLSGRLFGPANQVPEFGATFGLVGLRGGLLEVLLALVKLSYPSPGSGTPHQGYRGLFLHEHSCGSNYLPFSGFDPLIRGSKLLNCR